MTALEIVLTSVLGALVLVAILYLFIFHTNAQNRLQLFEVTSPNAEPGATVFFGDSLTDFFPIQDFFPRIPIYNRGIAGNTTKDLLKRLQDVINLAPSRVFIQIGTNDLGKAKKNSNIVQNIETIIGRIKAALPETEIMIISLYPVSHHKMWVSPFIAGLRTNKKIKRINEKLQALAANYHLTYIDMFPLLVDKKGRLDKRYTLEGLHISGLGYSVIARELEKYLM